MSEHPKSRFSATSVAGPFEPSPRDRVSLSSEAIAGAAALIVAFLVMTGLVLSRAFG